MHLLMVLIYGDTYILKIVDYLLYWKNIIILLFFISHLLALQFICTLDRGVLGESNFIAHSFHRF